MKITRVFLIFGVLAAAAIACLRIAGVIEADMASDVLARSLGIVTVIGLTVGLVGLLAGAKKSGSNPSSGPGPQF